MIRLSSLGDVILASAALGLRKSDEQIDWLTAEEYAPLLEGHPGLSRVILFDRKNGLPGWIRQCRELAMAGYDEVVDLHSSLRTWVFRVLLYVWTILGTIQKQKIHKLKKKKWRFWGYFVFKRFWPQVLKPEPFYRQACKTWRSNQEPCFPNLEHLVDREYMSPVLDQKYICVMPSARWKSKEWPVQKYLETIQQLKFLPVVMGAEKDLPSRELCELFQKNGIQYIDQVGKLSLREVAAWLAGAEFYLGNDTGLAHLAEAVGTPAQMIFGPTIPDMGYGPWRQESQGISANLGCSPCGKDGRFCYWPNQKYACMTRLEAEDVVDQIQTKTRSWIVGHS